MKVTSQNPTRTSKQYALLSTQRYLTSWYPDFSKKLRQTEHCKQYVCSSVKGGRRINKAFQQVLPLIITFATNCMICEDGIIFKGDRCVISHSMRKTVLEELHRPHLGLESTLRRARDIVFWPLLKSQLTDFVRSCDTCRTFDPQHQKEPLISHEILDQVWAKVAVDLFSFEGQDYLVIVDYLTNYWEVDNLSKDTTARNVIYKLKQQSGRYGIPQKLISDNGPQFRGREFKEFVERWGIQHETVSPYHPQANGKAESAVKTAKMLMRKAIHSGSDIWLSVLEYRNTPTQALDSSPAQRMFCRATCKHIN